MAKIYQVGGSLRDELIDPSIKAKDLDFAVEAGSFDEMRQVILNRGGVIFLETEIYLTIRAKVPDLGCADYVLCRKDGAYSDNRRPDSVSVGTIYDDLARRDLSINAIAKNASTGEIIDPHNGRKDIENRLLRCVGDPVDRFTEDSLRLLRLIRFSITKGFQIEKETEDCLYDGKIISLLKNVSSERIREELIRCFAHNTLKTLELLEKYRLLRFELFAGFDKAIWLKPTMEKP
jgi:tRNA nucleotidyltransferase (CCA-adding enzyme)